MRYPRWATLLVLLVVLPARAEEDKGLQRQQTMEEHRRLLAERRRGLVIGASSYRSVSRLPGAAHDVALVSGALEAAGFEITVSRNDDKKDIERAIIDFAVATRPEDVVLVYWSGHGVQRDGKNWLVPVDAELSSPERLSSEAIDLDFLLGTLGEHRGRLNMVLLDACRNNPWDRSWSASGKALGVSGLAQPASTPSGFVIAYATDPGRTAADGGNGPGPYAKALAETIASEWELQEVFQRVHAQVERDTEGGQRPWVTMALGPGRFFFTLPSAEDYLRRYGAGEPLGQLRVRAGFGGSLVIDGVERGELSRRGSVVLDLAPGEREVCLGAACETVEIVSGEQAELSFRPSRETLDWSPILEVAGGYTVGDIGLSYTLREDHDSDATPTAIAHGVMLTLGASVQPLPWLRAGLELGVETGNVSIFMESGACYSELRDWGVYRCGAMGVQAIGGLRIVGGVPWRRPWTPFLAMQLQLRVHDGLTVLDNFTETRYIFHSGLEYWGVTGGGVRWVDERGRGLGVEVQGGLSASSQNDAQVPSTRAPVGGVFRTIVRLEMRP